MTKTSNEMSLHDFLTTYHKSYAYTSDWAKEGLLRVYSQRVNAAGKTWIEPRNSITGGKVFYYDDSHIKNR
jgi:hypothetical protein